MEDLTGLAIEVGSMLEKYLEATKNYEAEYILVLFKRQGGFGIAASLPEKKVVSSILKAVADGVGREDTKVMTHEVNSSEH